MNLKASVIISTYNKPECLALVLYSYALQTEQHFEIIVADDGSDERTTKVIGDFSEAQDLKISHVWQEDDGFQKTKILNKAITTATADYLIFTDGDCIAREDFIATHLNLRRTKCALSGGYLKLNQDISESISKEVIRNQDCFDKKWLLEHGQAKSFKLIKLTKSSTKANLLNRLTPTKATFDGMNVSCWKTDISAVNGFDERMQYGAEDREVGERMMHMGTKFLQIRYSAICVHLYHDRPYKNEAALAKNKAIRRETKTKKLTYTPFGIQKN